MWRRFTCPDWSLWFGSAHDLLDIVEHNSLAKERRLVDGGIFSLAVLISPVMGPLPLVVEDDGLALALVFCTLVILMSLG